MFNPNLALMTPEDGFLVRMPLALYSGDLVIHSEGN